MVNNEFYVISMETRNGKKLYLKASDRNTKNICFEWTFDKSIAIWFDTITEIENFCKNYFKTFEKDLEIINKWEIESVFYTN